MKIGEIPCKNCITLSMCRAEKEKQRKVSALFFIFKKCSLIESYMEGQRSLNIMERNLLENEIYYYLKVEVRYYPSGYFTLLVAK